MNLVEHGAHSAADWLMQLLRRNDGMPLEISVMAEGTLHWRFYRKDAAPRRFGTVIGVFTRGISRRDLFAELHFVRLEMVEGRAA